ncbi:uncharacterized protein LOC111884013 [Lactuca sativa]|uniref:uncharacterized protein LOC111884013 n=1 Tax=Lactuca sativa TaxID=4236 RepID=UPI0022B0340A|nr:uncharacterized protein LOC111884013 [Lactuca sativa]
MHTTKGTTPKALQIKLQSEATHSNNGVGESSFRVLYYGTASAGSVPFMWESQPGTPKHALTESSLPPLTPPPSYNQFTQKYNSSMQMINHSPKTSSFLRAIFLSSSRKRNMKVAPPSSFSTCSVSSSSCSSSQSTPMRKTDGWRRTSVVKFGLEEDIASGAGSDSPTSTLCFGGGLKKGYKIKKVKKAMLSFVRHGTSLARGKEPAR